MSSKQRLTVSVLLANNGASDVSVVLLSSSFHAFAAFVYGGMHVGKVRFDYDKHLGKAGLGGARPPADPLLPWRLKTKSRCLTLQNIPQHKHSYRAVLNSSKKSRIRMADLVITAPLSLTVPNTPGHQLEEQLNKEYGPGNQIIPLGIQGCRRPLVHM